MIRSLATGIAAVLLATVELTGAAAGTGVTKIAPAEAGHPFTIIDSGPGRLDAGSVRAADTPLFGALAFNVT